MIFSISLFALCFWLAAGGICLVLFQYALSLRGNLYAIRNAVDERNKLDADLYSTGQLHLNLTGGHAGMVATMVNSGQVNDCNQSIGAIELNNNAVTNAQNLMNIDFLDKNGLPLSWDQGGKISLDRIYRIAGDGWSYAASFNGITWRLVYETGHCRKRAEQLDKDVEILNWYVNPIRFFRSHPLSLIVMPLILWMLLMIVLLYLITWK